MGRPTGKSLPKIARRRSGIAGWGVFAASDISKNTRIIDYAGELVHNSVSEAREDRYLREGCVWVFRVNRNWSRDANVGGNVARFINHSCTPNCEAIEEEGRIFIETIKKVALGEELTYDYNLILEERHTPAVKRAHACFCGTRRCRGTLLGVKR